ncbi:MAG: HD domain-containing protein [Oscillospiraceae bacterium]|nr:HD domain-containing protein [Oscillospiraceae bacterium]
MRPYQKEYIENIREIAALTARKDPDGLTLEAYEARMRRDEAAAWEKVGRNMTLLREGLFSTLDHLFDADRETLEELEEFATHLMGGKETQDEGVFRLIHRALLSLARQKGDRCGMIRELYWLGMGYYWLYSKLVGLPLEVTEKYANQMRLSFTEAAAYLKYFEEIEDTETRGYMLRSRANMSLGSFKSSGEKIRLVRDTLCIMQDESYRQTEPDLPWERYLYMTHQQMASSVSYSKEQVMSPEDMAWIMESAYIVYHQRLEEAAASGGHTPLRWAFPYYAMEYYCGIYDMDHLMARIEKLMDQADPADVSPDGMYGILSLPAFYCQYLEQNPERIPAKASYLEGLYQRALEYAGRFPAQEDEKLSLYLRQLSFTYIETQGGVPYGVYLQKLLLRFAPEAYLHSRMVGEAARALCGLIMEEEPTFFDDVVKFRQIDDPEAKRRQVLDDAMTCGLLHDVGKISFLELYSRTARQWFEEEYEVTRLHTTAGHLLLSERASTKRFAPIALGHHAWYDGSSHGYPEAYRRLECPCRQMVDVIGLVDWLENVSHSAQAYTGMEMGFDEAVEEAISLEGRRFSPMLTARLRDKQVAALIWDAFERGRKEAYRRMYYQKDD